MRFSSSVPIRVYSADSAPGGILQSLRTACVELYLARGVIWRLFLRDFNVQFRQKLLGYFWAFLAPLIGIASFVFLSVVGVLQPGDTAGIPYPLFVFFGAGTWALLMAILQTVSGGLVVHGELVMRTSIPRIALTVSGLASTIYGQLIHLLTLTLLLFLFHRLPAWEALFYPFLVAPIFALGIGLGLLLAAIGTLARDVTSIVTTFLGLVMFLTPVVYVPRFNHPVCQAIVNWNPLTYLIDVPRRVFFLGDFSRLDGFLWSSCLAFVVLVLGIHGFYLIQDKIVERI